MRRIFREIVCAVITTSDQKIFLARKDPGMGGAFADKWQLPGGGVEMGETHEEALIRELEEEVGIKPRRRELYLVDSDGEGENEKVLDNGERVLSVMKFYVYRLDLTEKSSDIKIRLGAELTSYAWFDAAELEKLELVPVGIPLFRRIGIIPGGPKGTPETDDF